MGNKACLPSFNRELDAEEIKEITPVQGVAAASEPETEVQTPVEVPEPEKLQTGCTIAKRDHLVWLNAAAAHMWSDLEQVMQVMVTERVEPVIRAKLPENFKSIHFAKFKLGGKPPIIDLIENYNLPHGSSGVHCTIVYDSDMEVTMATGTRGITFGMKNFSLRGEIVFLLRPYIEEASGHGGTGGVTVYFINPPHVGLEFTGLAGVADLMGIKGIIRGAIDSALAEKLVLPHSITQLIGYKDFKMYPLVMGNPPPIGALRVKSKTAKDLPSGDWSLFGVGLGGKDDNYLKIAIGDSSWQTRASNMGSENEFMIFDPEQLVFIDLWDEDQYSADDHLGTAGPYHLYEVVSKSEQPIPLKNPTSGKPAGTVEFSFEYFTGKMQQLGSSGGILLCQIREMHVKGMQDSKLVVEALFGEQEPRVSPTGTVLKNVQEENAVKSVLRDVQERLKKQGMKQKDIDKVIQEDGLTLRQAKTRIALNAFMLFSIKRDYSFDGNLELKLWDRKGTTDKTAVKNNNHDKDELLGTASIPLSSLRSAKDLTFTQNDFPFKGKNGTVTYEAELMLSICGLEPAEPPEVNTHGQIPPSVEAVTKSQFSFISSGIISKSHETGKTNQTHQTGKSFASWR